ncbi:hypothetical protein AB0467_21370 [Streptomyces sp. NPDC052095]
MSRARELAGELSRDGLVGTLAEMEFLKARLEPCRLHADLDQ